MQLYHAVYHSRRCTQHDTDLQDILDISQRNNHAAGLTGALVADDRYFMQVLEGPRAVLTRLLLKITQDDRHTDCELALFNVSNERLFTGWSMGIVCINEANREFLTATGLPPKIQPENMSGQMIWDLVLTVAGYEGQTNGLLANI